MPILTNTGRSRKANRVGRNNPAFFAALAVAHLKCSPSERVQDARDKPGLLPAFFAAVGHRLLCANQGFHDGDMESRQHSKDNLIFEPSPAIIFRNYRGVR
jgi:hypothetical protein